MVDAPVPPHFHKEYRIQEEDIIPNGAVTDEVPTGDAPEGTQVVYLNGSDFRVYKMVRGAWREIGTTATPDTFDPFRQFLDLVGFPSLDAFTIDPTLNVGVATPYSSHLFLQTSSGGAGAEIWISQAEYYYNLFETGKKVTVEWIVPELTSPNGGLQDFYLVCSSGTPAITTQHHFGFNIQNNVIHTTSGNGTTTETTITALPITNSNHMYRLRAEAIRGDDVKFYVDDILVATHTTNIPDTDHLRLNFGAKSGNAGAEEIRINRVLIRKDY